MHKTLNFDSNCRALIIGASGGIGSSLRDAIDRLYGTNDIIEISRSTDGLDITNEESIKNVLSRLDGEFDLKLEDFLPQPETSGAQSALPPQPMPNPSVIGQVQPQQMTTAQGLTPTEMALLSPEEQQIRLRQRGLMS